MAGSPLSALRIGGRTAEGYRSVDVESSRGTILMRLYEAAWGDAGVVYVGGVGGGFDTPGDQLYPRLAAELTDLGVAGLRLSYRDPLDLEEARFDVLAGVELLRREGMRRIGLVGHSFGGPAVIQAAVEDRAVRTVVTISSQGYGADGVGELPPDCSILLIHGESDDVLHPSISRWIYSRAHAPKRLLLLPGGSHVLDESAERLRELVAAWLIDELATP